MYLIYGCPQTLLSDCGELSEEKDRIKYLIDLKVDNEKSIQNLEDKLLESELLRTNEVTYLKRKLEKCQQETQDLCIKLLKEEKEAVVIFCLG
jgi:hypothetical protein